MKFIKFEKTGEIIPANRIFSVKPSRTGTSLVEITMPELGFTCTYSIEKEPDVIIQELFSDTSFRIISFDMKKVL